MFVRKKRKINLQNWDTTIARIGCTSKKEERGVYYFLTLSDILKSV